MDRIVRKVLLRIVPFMILLYLLNYLDRVNISFAKLEMNAALGFSDSIYGFGVSIFFIGYCFFEVPSNLMMEKVGARLWIARIMISWGLISSLMMFITGAWSYCGMRLLLGVAEAGFFPGMILYLTYWVPAKQRAQAGAWFLTSTALSGVLGSPLAAVILKLDGAFGIEGWRWLFLLEGIPSILLGFVVLIYLKDRPAQARWLSPDEQAQLAACLKSEQSACAAHGHTSMWPALKDKKVWLLSLIYVLLLFGFYGIQYWTPTIIKAVSNESDQNVALLTAIPYLAAAIGMVAAGWSSDRFGERRLHVAFCAFLGCAGMVAACFATASTTATIAALSVAAIGIFGTLGPFWALPPAFLGGTAAAAGIALINSLGNLGSGFIGPNIMGVLKDITKSHVAGLAVFAGALFISGCITLFVRLDAPGEELATADATDQPAQA